MPPSPFKRLARRLGGDQLAPRPSALRRLPRAKVAQGTPEKPAAPDHALERTTFLGRLATPWALSGG